MVTLTYGTRVITLDDPDSPYLYSWISKQTMHETESGQRYVFDFGVKRKRWNLKWDFLPASQFSALEDFVVNVVNFKEIPFTFKDYNGISYTVRCVSLTHSQRNRFYYSVTLILEEEV